MTENSSTRYFDLLSNSNLLHIVHYVFSLKTNKILKRGESSYINLTKYTTKMNLFFKIGSQYQKVAKIKLMLYACIGEH